MLIDSRDYLDAEGWPVISDRDRLPLMDLLDGAHLTNGFVRQLNAVGFSRDDLRRAAEIRASRDAVALQLTLPAWWHYCTVRSYRCSNEPKRQVRRGVDLGTLPTPDLSATTFHASPTQTFWFCYGFKRRGGRWPAN